MHDLPLLISALKRISSMKSRKLMLVLMGLHNFQSMQFHVIFEMDKPATHTAAAGSIPVD